VATCGATDISPKPTNTGRKRSENRSKFRMCLTIQLRASRSKVPT